MGKRHIFLMLFLILSIGNINIENTQSKNGTKIPSVDFLVESQNPSGGWGYGFGSQSFTEPTAFATLALSSTKCSDKKCQNAITNGVAWLLETQNPDGGWGAIKSSPSNINTAIAVYSLYNSQIALPSNSLKINISIDKGIDWLLKNRENHTQFPVTGGWAWTPGTYDFAEPTAYGIMGISTENPMNISEILNVLYYLQCDDGGWNVAKLDESRPIQTAITLIAFKKANVSRNDDITKGIRYLEDNIGDMNTSLTTAWSLIALDSYNSEKAPETAKKLKKMRDKKDRFSNPYVTSIVTIALESHYGDDL